MTAFKISRLRRRTMERLEKNEDCCDIAHGVADTFESAFSRKYSRGALEIASCIAAFLTGSALDEMHPHGEIAWRVADMIRGGYASAVFDIADGSDKAINDLALLISDASETNEAAMAIVDKIRDAVASRLAAGGSP